MRVVGSYKEVKCVTIGAIVLPLTQFMETCPNLTHKLSFCSALALLILVVVEPLQAQVTTLCETATSDSDGDGFGWEYGRSCLVAGLLQCQQADSDPDGDGFGWENNVSCRMPQTASVRPQCTNPASDPDGDGFGWESGQTCIAITDGKPACQLAGSDPDGDGFGWENGHTCIVTGALQLDEELYSLPYPACSAARYDPAGTGYGWENSLTCTTRNFGDSGEITDIVLITGQSNALGAATVLQESGAFDATLDSPVQRVYAYTNTGWTIAGLRQIWDLDWYPRSDIVDDPANNFAFHFAKQLVRADASKVVGIILVTAPGESISHWDKGQAFQQEIAQKVTAALAALPHKNAIDAVLWHQGESDHYDTVWYGSKLSQLIETFRTEPWFQSQSLFICGETLNSPVNARLWALNDDGDSTTGCVSSQGLDSVGDDLHFSAWSLRELGARYAAKYRELMQNH